MNKQKKLLRYIHSLIKKANDEIENFNQREGETQFEGIVKYINSSQYLGVLAFESIEKYLKYAYKDSRYNFDFYLDDDSKEIVLDIKSSKSYSFPTTGTMVRVLRELYDTAFLPPNLAAKYHLTSRYWDKVSEQLKQEANDILDWGRILCGDGMRKLVYSRNPFLSLIPKNDSDFSSKYYPVLLTYEYGE